MHPSYIGCRAPNQTYNGLSCAGCTKNYDEFCSRHFSSQMDEPPLFPDGSWDPKFNGKFKWNPRYESNPAEWMNGFDGAEPVYDTTAVCTKHTKNWAKCASCFTQDENRLMSLDLPPKCSYKKECSKEIPDRDPFVMNTDPCSSFCEVAVPLLKKCPNAKPIWLE